MCKEIIIINNEPFYRIPNGTSYDYAPIPKEFKPYFERLQQENQQLKEELKDMTLCRDIASGHRKELQDEELRQRRLKEKYKSVLDEIRELTKIGVSTYKNGGSRTAMFEVFDTINEILDKVE